MANELRSEPLAVCEHRRHVLCEVPDIACERDFPLPIQASSHAEPAGDHPLPRLDEPGMRRIVDR